MLYRHEERSTHKECCDTSERWQLNQTIGEKISRWRQIIENIIEDALIMTHGNMPFRNKYWSNPGIFYR